MSGWVGHRAGRNSVVRIQYIATAGNRNTIPRKCGHYNDNVVTAASNDTYQFESNSIIMVIMMVIVVMIMISIMIIAQLKQQI